MTLADAIREGSLHTKTTNKHWLINDEKGNCEACAAGAVLYTLGKRPEDVPLSESINKTFYEVFPEWKEHWPSRPSYWLTSLMNRYNNDRWKVADIVEAYAKEHGIEPAVAEVAELAEVKINTDGEFELVKVMK